MDAPKARTDCLRIFDGVNEKCSIFVTDTKRIFTIGETEKRVLDLLNGENSLETIQEESQMAAQDIGELVEKFREAGMIEDTPPKKKLNVLRIKFGLFCPNDFLEKHRKIVSFFYVIITYFSLPVLVLSILLNVKAFRSLTTLQISSFINMENILIYLVTSFFALLVHELSHAVAAKRNGANVAEIGIMLYVFQLVAYCTLCSMDNIRSFRKRVAVYMAGINSNMMLSGLILLMVYASGKGTIGQHTVTVLITNLVPVLINFIVFMKYDSYYLLSDLLCEPHLRENTFSYLKSVLGKRTQNMVLHSSQKLVYWIYGILSAMFFLLLPILMATAIIMEFV